MVESVGSSAVSKPLKAN
ncbi:hypothetical protein VCCP1050_3109, partial [Vibrio cholerae CP1050(23)]